MSIIVRELDCPNDTRSLEVTESEINGQRFFHVLSEDKDTTAGDAAVAHTVIALLYPLGQAWSLDYSRLLVVRYTIQKIAPEACIAAVFYSTRSDNSIDVMYATSSGTIKTKHKRTGGDDGVEVLIAEIKTIPIGVLNISVTRTESQAILDGRYAWGKNAGGPPISTGSQLQRVAWLWNATNAYFFMGFDTDTVKFDGAVATETAEGLWRVTYNFQYKRWKRGSTIRKHDEILDEDGASIDILNSKDFGVLELKWRDKTSM